MSANERRRLIVFRQVKHEAISVAEAARSLGLSERQSRRLWKRFRLQGDAGLIHGLRGQPGNAAHGALRELQTISTLPPGYAGVNLAAADTAEQQSAGGGQSAAVGQGALLAGRTRNAGSADAAVGASTRAVGQQLSEGALQTRLKNAGMKMQQQQAGIGGLGNLYSENLGAVAPNVNANTEAENASWDWAKDLMGPMLGAAGGAASPGGAITKAFT